MRKFFVLLILFASTIFVSAQKNLSVDDLYTNRAFFGQSLNNVQWLGEGSVFTYLKRGQGGLAIYEVDGATGEEKVLVQQSNLIPQGETDPIQFFNYEFSNDGTKILFTGTLPARSLKTGGNFYIYDIAEKKITASFESEEEQALVHFSPDGAKVSYISKNNLWVVDVASGDKKQLTFDGSANILNGIFDWVYEEEFSIINAYEWAPDSKAIAYWRLDQSNVPEIKIQKWDSLYLNTLDMRYPKAGTQGSLVKIGVVSIQSGNTVWQDIGSETDIYIPRIKFTKNSEYLSIQRLNRLQNTLDLLVTNVSTGTSKTVLTEKNRTWVDVHDNLLFVNDTGDFIWSSERSGYNHLYLVSENGEKVKQLTTGNWEVFDVQSVDTKNKVVYFTGNKDNVLDVDFYSVNFSGGDISRLTKTSGTHRIDMSPNSKYYINSVSSVSSVTGVTLNSTEKGEVKQLIAPKNDFLKEYNPPAQEFVTFTTSDGIELNAAIIKPVGYEAGKKYPVLVYNYSGPGSNVVQNSWGSVNYMWHALLAQKGYVVFMVDNRGTGKRGKAFKELVYERLGDYEVGDIVEGVEYLIKQGIADSNRIGIWGWSYGGYVAALAIAKRPDIFKTSIAVAPVTDWQFYDNIYTERYMSTPALNPEGYKTSSVMHYADKYVNGLLLVHGTADDNVHFQNSVKLTEALIQNKKPFRTMYYPEKHHGIQGLDARVHLYNMMTEYLLEKL